ncbi:hypothetical protein L6164_007267 [Bauhinia variegata]|uniref:Uncharacterized protein n=1 Tax=Bauhinia variegata TaxID=167791 RepID=A0ACB9PFU5_BAUVA|nr:hypothetical protein L6164_007267 [Bauhinia variegata]
MGKLGKKARKFAKKNLQSVLRQKRKLISKFKRKASKRDNQDIEEDQEKDVIHLSTVRNPVGEEIEDASVDSMFSEDESEMLEDDSDSDGYLSEDSSYAYVTGDESQNEISFENRNSGSALLAQNKDIHAELSKKSRKLNKLKQKDPGFSKFLESYDEAIKQAKIEENNSDVDDSDEDKDHPLNDDTSHSHVTKLLTSAFVDSWCKLVKQQNSVPALTCLINAYRAACHNSSEETSVVGSVLSYGIQKRETSCEILMFVLHEADSVFKKLLGISSSSYRKEYVLELKNTTKWGTLRPLIKSYLRSTLFLLNQVTDSEILTFSVARFRPSIILLAAFPSLLCRLVKIAVHLWATGDGSLSSHSFLMIRDIASVFGSDWFDSCFARTYKAFINHSQLVEPSFFEHRNFLRNSFVELCCLDVQKSSNKAMICIQQLAKILQKGWQTKMEDVVKKICSWQYINSIDLWVVFISVNIRDYDLQPLLYMIVQIINGVALLFPGPRYLPLRVRCIQWLNHLSSSSGIFIPVTSMVVDILEYKISKDSGKPGQVFEPSSAIKLPKHWLKSRDFREECVLSAIKLLSAHFAQWSYHISFPELATIPLVHLKKFCKITSIESFKRIMKRFIDQVELNIEFVQKRDEMAFSPKDQQSVESFLQVEKNSCNIPFTQHYKSSMSKATSRKKVSNRKCSSKQVK